MERAEVAALVERLTRGDQEGYIALKALLALSAQGTTVYPYMTRFADMLDSDNSYVRMRAFALLAANAQWDSDNHLDECLDALLAHLRDPKPIAVRKCIQALPEIAAAKPELREDIISALGKVEAFRYADSMRPLIEKDVREALARIKEAE